MKKKKHFGVVYSTDPSFTPPVYKAEEQATLGPERQKLRVHIDRKQRGGKEVTLVTGFVGLESDLQDLGKQLKNKCGTGGSVKDGEILVQGNQRDKVIRFLLEWGYVQTKPAGG